MAFRSKVLIRSLALGVAIGALLPAVAYAQSTTDKPDEESSAVEKDIVVTGTLIRGIAPVGNNVIGINRKKIDESGATTSGELLARLPQIGYFGNVPYGPAPQVGSNQSNPISRPELRALPNGQTSGGAQTLVLIDGHRVVGAGTQQVGVDPDILAPGAVQRVEALTDGGSAVYGSDAVGGVINFITRKRFNGLEANARVGIGDDVTTFDAYVTAGKDWGSGGVYVSYSYSHHDELFGRDRAYIKRIDYNTGIPSGRFCAAPNVTATGSATTYVVSGSGLVAGGPNACDPSSDVTYFPRATAHNVFARFNQDLASWVSFDATVLYGRRDTLSNAGTLGSNTYASAVTGQVTLRPTSPFYRAIPGAVGIPNEVVMFNYAGAFGTASMPQRTILSTYEIAPEFTFKPGGGWQIRTLFSYGSSSVGYSNRTVNSVVQSSVLGTSVNPFDLTGASTNAADLARIPGTDTGFGRNELYDYRVIADGSLFHLPGGDLKIAVGGERLQDNFRNRVSLPTLTGFTQGPKNSYTQTVLSAFGEAQIPIVGSDIAFFGMRELTVSASARYDKYNDFGDTFNPKLGLNWKPISWISIRANWGKSFTAPSPTDQLGTTIGQAVAVSNAALTPPPQGVSGAAGFGQPSFASNEAALILLNGSAPGLQPQRSRNWSVGATIEPPFVAGLELSASYYHIDLDGALGRPVGVDLTPFYTNYTDLFLFRPSGIAVQNYLTNGSIAPANTLITLCNPTSTAQAIYAPAGSATGCASNTGLVGAFLDTRNRNLGGSATGGLDFAASYQRPTSFGSIDASFSGNLRLELMSRASPTSPFVNGLTQGSSVFKYQATLGADIHNFRIQGTFSHKDGSVRAGGASAANFGQGLTDAFEFIDLYMKYDVKSGGAFKNMSVTLNIQNLLNTNPPAYLSSASTTPGFDPSTTFTLGRVFQIGVRKKF